MLKEIFLAVTFGFICGGSASALGDKPYDPRLAGSAVYSDPGFQDFIETTYGYLNPRYKTLFTVDFRDAVASPAAAPKKAVRAGAKTRNCAGLRAAGKCAYRSARARFNYKKFANRFSSAR